MDENIELMINETMDSYYGYIVKIEEGCRAIVSAIQNGELILATDYLKVLSEGLLWILETEDLLKLHSYYIESPISEVIPLFEKINVALEQQNLPDVANILEEQFIPLFKTSMDCQFQKVVN